MDFIKPTEITDALFFGSDIPENDYQEWESGSPYTVGDTVIVTTQNVHKVFECLTSVTGGLTPDLLDEDCSDISDWTDDDEARASSSVDPAGQFKFRSNGVAGRTAARYRTIDSPPNEFSLDIKTYFDEIGAAGNDDFILQYSTSTWCFNVKFCSDGLFVVKDGGAVTEVGTNIVKCNDTAAWQTWRFEVDKSGGEASATVEVFLKEEGGNYVSQGTFDCDYVDAWPDGKLNIRQEATLVNYPTSHIDHLKIATGCYRIATTEDLPQNGDWLELSATNRWAAFDGTIGNQASQASLLTHILRPGALDSVALLNLESTTVRITEIDEADNLITNGDSWTGASGTTQPTGWDKVGTPADFTIEDEWLKITADAANEGISQTKAVSAQTQYQLIGKYRNGTADIAQYAIYDVTNSADIVATTDLTSDDTAVGSALNRIFTTPAGCLSVKISLMAKASGDVVYFDEIILAPTEYSETVTTGSSKTDVVKLDLPSVTTPIVLIRVNNTAGDAKIGELIVGVKTNIGTMRYSPSIGITDYSTKTVDTFGHYSIVARTFAKRLNCSLIILNTAIDEVIRLLTLYRSTELVWVGDENYNSLIVYGFYKNFQVVFARPQSSDCSLEIEGLT